MLKWLFIALILPGLAWAQEPVRPKVPRFNIWSGGDQVSFASVIEAIKLADADVAGLQEPNGRTLDTAAARGGPAVPGGVGSICPWNRGLRVAPDAG